uniref:Uncharacterized protein n=1 Tax=Anguilla anguilla TaxID=7936 RepID=A0A0E9QWT6_ANGAN
MMGVDLQSYVINSHCAKCEKSSVLWHTLLNLK